MIVKSVTGFRNFLCALFAFSFYFARMSRTVRTICFALNFYASQEVQKKNTDMFIHTLCWFQVDLSCHCEDLYSHTQAHAENDAADITNCILPMAQRQIKKTGHKMKSNRRECCKLQLVTGTYCFTETANVAAKHCVLFRAIDLKWKKITRASFQWVYTRKSWWWTEKIIVTV